MEARDTQESVIQNIEIKPSSDHHLNFIMPPQVSALIEFVSTTTNFADGKIQAMIRKVGTQKTVASFKEKWAQKLQTEIEQGRKQASVVSLISCLLPLVTRRDASGKGVLASFMALYVPKGKDKGEYIDVDISTHGITDPILTAAIGDLKRLVSQSFFDKFFQLKGQASI